MISISIKHNIAETVRLLEAKHSKQIGFATALALTKTAQLASVAVVEQMRSRFDRPTPYTLKSLYIKAATKQKLQAMVYLKGSPLYGGNPNSLAEILEQQYAGGTRIRKRLEKALSRAGLISDTEYVAPGAAARLDQYGNMSRGQIQQILSQLHAGIDPLANSSNSKRSKASVKRAGAMFWSRGGRLARGVWMRDGRGVRPILIVISRPQYRQRIDLNRIVQQVVDTRFDGEFTKALDYANRTAR